MHLSHRLGRETPYVGTLASPESAIALAVAGFDWLFVDMEHSPVLDPTAVLRIVEAIAGRIDVLVRVPTNDGAWTKKVLDTGADGVIVPQVNNAGARIRGPTSPATSNGPTSPRRWSCRSRTSRRSRTSTRSSRCAAAGMPLGFFSTTTLGARTALQRGIRFLAVGTDLGLLMGAGRDTAASLR